MIDAVIKICREIELAGYKFISVRNTRERLWVEFKPVNKIKEAEVNLLAGVIVPELETIKTKLRGTRIAQSGSWRDSFAFRAAIILAISTGLAINAIVHFFRLIWNEVPFLVDIKPVSYDSAQLGLVFVVVFVVIIFKVLGRSARTHIVLIEVLLVGSFGASANGFMILRDINIEFDTAQGTEYETKVLDRTISRSRNSSSYYLHVIDWNKPVQREKIEVARSFYRTVSIGDELRLIQKPGHLGYRWVSSLSRK